jgi:hypothetical protein
MISIGILSRIIRWVNIQHISKNISIISNDFLSANHTCLETFLNTTDNTGMQAKIERIYGNQRLSELQGALKVFVKAEGLSETEEMLHQFKDILPSSLSFGVLMLRCAMEAPEGSISLN